ncbi:hypothetical protein KH5_06500 [Urechidicola sp. KH5]
MRAIIFAVLLAIILPMNAQNYKFGKVSKEELQEQFYPLDSSANAAVLYKKRRTHTRSTGSGLEIVTDIHVRMKLYDKEGFDHATEEVFLYMGSNSNAESAGSFKAVTYNLEGDKIVSTKLEKKAIKTQNLSERLKVKKFTMPNLKPGSVIEWSYTIISPFLSQIDPLEIQLDIPVKRYEATLKLLEWYKFRKLQKGYIPFNIKESYDSNIDLDIRNQVITVVESNIPALKVEPYVDNIWNYATGLELEVVALTAPKLGIYQNYATSWEEIAKDIYNSDNFGGQLSRSGHLKEAALELMTKYQTTESKSAAALDYIKSKIAWNGNYGEYPQNGLKKALREGAGNIGDINLNLVALLRELGLNANPVLITTRSRGIPLFPTTDKINYVIAVIETPKGQVLLDASEKYSKPNLLPLRAVNYQGIIVRKNKTIGYTDLGSNLKSTTESNLSYKLEEDGFVTGMNRRKYDNLRALNYRKRKGRLDEEDLISQIESQDDDIEIVNFRLSNRDDVFKPVVEMYKFEKEDAVEEIGGKLYFSPLLFLANTENPFKLEKREYPVDFGSPFQNKNIVNITIPAGFAVEALPEDVAVGMTDKLGTFIYRVKVVGNKIQVTSMFEINAGVISGFNYEELKGFYQLMISKQTEKIVLVPVEG